MPAAMCCVLPYMLEAVEGRFCLLEVLEVICHVLLCILKAVESELYLLGAVEGEVCLMEELKARDLIRCMSLCMLEIVEDEFCLLELLEIPVEVPESMYCVLLCIRTGDCEG